MACQVINWENQYYPLEVFITGKEASNGDVELVRSGLKLMLSQRSERVAKLRRFVGFQGIHLENDKGELIKLCEFFTKNVEFHFQEYLISNEWAEFCLDVAVFIGETARQRFPSIRWAILEEQDPEHPYYLDIGITDGHNVHLDVFEHMLGFANNVLTDTLLEEEFRSVFFWGTLEEIIRRGQ